VIAPRARRITWVRHLAASLRVLAAIAALASATAARAQTPTPAEAWVVLPVDEYRPLRDRTLPQPPATIASTLTRIEYDLRPEGDAIAGRALLTIDVLRDGWTRAPIPSGLMVHAMRRRRGDRQERRSPGTDADTRTSAERSGWPRFLPATPSPSSSKDS
jgi:hypothetical protein